MGCSLPKQKTGPCHLTCELQVRSTKYHKWDIFSLFLLIKWMASIKLTF
ncbi:rCG36186, partial [Rattus norvegicus]